MSVWGIIVAGGRGERSGLQYNKVFYPIRGRSVLSRSIDAMANAGCFDGLVLVISKEDAARYDELCLCEGSNPLVRQIVHGGDSRRASVYNGLKALPEGVDIVAVHDAARPFVSAEAIRATIASACEYGSGIISTPVTDTIKQRLSDGTIHTLDRSSLYAVQTPQAFDCRMLIYAHKCAQRDSMDATDDAALYERYAGPINLVSVPGGEENVKLTNSADFARYNRPSMRIGSGYDAHRLKEGRRLILCGVEVPHDRGLDGHSDADVAVHALMDALLGALGKGDIGKLFPDNDPAYEGASSMGLLARVMQIVDQAGYVVCNADVTIVAQRPKLAPFIPFMKENLANALQTEAVSVKATTTEHMRFDGEEIGISDKAVELLMED